MRLSSLALSTTSVLLLTSVNGLRGVPKEKEGLYKPDENGNWKCLNNPEIVISFDKVNDDYCDCPDGSDEPGTSACAGVVKRGDGFYCENKGHIPGLLPFNRVDDGACDYDICCDGSDEKEGACDNRCKEIHEKYIQVLKVKQDALEKGLREREKLVHLAATARDDQQKEVVKKEKELDDKKKFLVTRQEVLSKLVDEYEAAISSGEASIVTGNTPESIEKIANQLDELKASYIEYASTLSSVDAERSQFDNILETLKGTYNPNFNDPAVKDGIRSWEEVKGNSDLSKGSPILDTDSLSKLIQQLREYRDESAVLIEQQQSIAKGGLIFKILSLFIPPGNQQRLAEYLYESQVWLARQGLIAYPSVDHPGSGRKSGEQNEPPAIRDARKVIENLEKEINDIQSSIQTIHTDLSSDYGTDDVLRALRNVCIENPVGEYDYEVCFFGQATQKGKGSHTNLGSYSSIKRDGDHLVMTFENGAKCWNGPVRRAQVDVYCGSTSQIISVSEPEKCEYFFKMTNPSACDPNDRVESEISHTDL